MISIIEKYGPFIVKRVWFKNTSSEGCTLLRLMRLNEPSNKTISINELSYTVINDLTINENDLLMATKKTVRNEIRRAENDGLELNFYYSEQLKYNIYLVDKFEYSYKKFADRLENKYVKSAYSRKKINQYIDANCLVITEIKKDNINIYHAYVYDENESVLIYSISNIREYGVDKNLVGRANKYLHYQDMLMFKRLGLKYFDWGNISNPEKLNGIDNFKLSFGGMISKKYNILIGGNAFGKLFIKYYNKKKVGKI